MKKEESSFLEKKVKDFWVMVSALAGPNPKWLADDRPL
jgi:hypothetical protein